MQAVKRCSWCGSDPLYVAYHDEEWGKPVYDSEALFAKLMLDGAQAGLSWITILKKRENYYNAFDQFNPEIIASYNSEKVEQLMQNSGIVRNRLKINATISNAQAYLALQKHQSFSDYLWKFVDGKPIINNWETYKDAPTKTPISIALSKDLKKKGFKFVGPTIIYAFMQAVGMVNDHINDCEFKYEHATNK